MVDTFSRQNDVSQSFFHSLQLRFCGQLKQFQPRDLKPLCSRFPQVHVLPVSLLTAS